MFEDGSGFRCAPDVLRGFAASLFAAAGMDREKAETVAEVLVDADMLGHATHGLALVPRYMDEIAAGRLVTSGEPEIVSDRGACVIWNGRNLSGIWLTSKAFALALERAGTYGVVSIAISHCHHIGCLAAYLPRVTERGCVALIYSSGPALGLLTRP